MPYITKIIQKDLRYNKEKETRRQDNKEKQKHKSEYMLKTKEKRKTRKTGLSKIIDTNK